MSMPTTTKRCGTPSPTSCQARPPSRRTPAASRRATAAGGSPPPPRWSAARPSPPAARADRPQIVLADEADRVAAPRRTRSGPSKAISRSSVTSGGSLRRAVLLRSIAARPAGFPWSLRSSQLVGPASVKIPARRTPGRRPPLGVDAPTPASCCRGRAADGDLA
jgi:hypothetical protein